MKAELGEDLDIEWRSFSLEQANSKEGDDWKSWEQGPEYESRGVPALRASEAARGQGVELHNNYVLALLKARHVDRADIRQQQTLVDVARDSGLDVERFESDLDDPRLLAQIGRDHETAAAEGVFGTPTYVFEDARPAFLKMFAPPEEQAMEVWQSFVGLARDVDLLGELKRPQPPWPKGLFDES